MHLGVGQSNPEAMRYDITNAQHQTESVKLRQ